MKILIRFLSVCTACFALGTAYGDSPIGGPGPTFANSGGLSGNKTAFTGNIGALNNNRWNNAMNPNPMGQQGAVADFGNCNSLILRCAQPKCSGCTTIDLALPIVSGCVQSNPSCKQYGDALIQTLAAQMVSTANAKATEAQNAAAAQAASAATTQSNEQIQQMQQQMTQMQQQMQEQSAQSAMAVQQALDEQRQLAAQAQQAPAQPTYSADTAITNAATNGVSADVLAREQIGGQILTQLENADVAMKDLKSTMQNVFDYARCDINGNNCQGPRRVKAFKDKANKFFDPYESVLDELYDALILAQTLGVDITDIYMMLNGSCNVWGKYMCEPCDPDKATDESITFGHACTNGTATKDDNGKISKTGYFYDVKKDWASDGSYKVSSKQAHCTLLNMLTNQEEVQQNWLNMDAGSSGGIRVACASDAIENSMLFKNRKKQAAIDIDILRRIVNQDAPAIGSKADDAKTFCETSSDDKIEILKNMVELKKLPVRNLCVKKDKMDTSVALNTESSNNGCGEDNDNDYINSIVALCSTHAYNIGAIHNPTDKQKMNNVVALKSTIITQQMKKQYDFLNVTTKRLKTQLEKSILTAKVQAAGGNATDSSTNTKSNSGDKNIILAGTENCNNKATSPEVFSCLRSNYNLIYNMSNGGQIMNSDAKKQLAADYNVMIMNLPNGMSEGNLNKNNLGCSSASGISGKTQMQECLQILNSGIRQASEKVNQKSNSGNSDKFGQQSS